MTTNSPAAATAPPQSSIAIGLALAAFGAVAFSAKAIIIKLAYRHGVDAVTLLMYRMLFALPMFVLMGWWGGRGKPPLAARDRLLVMALGFGGYYFSSFLDFLGLQYITASLERLILYLNPTLVLLLSWALLGKRASARQLVALAVSYGGVLLVFGHELQLAGANVLLGGALVFGSALTYALYLIASGQAVGRIGSVRLTGWATSWACVFCIAQFALLRPLETALVPAPVLWLSVLNAVLCTAAPVLMVMMAIERIGATLTAQSGMVGPLSTITLGVLVLGEPFTGWVVAGTVLVLAGIALLARAR